MARCARAFTLAEKTSAALDALVAEGLESKLVQNLFTPIQPSTDEATFDAYNLSAADYATIYAALPQPKNKWNAKLEPKQLPTWDALWVAVKYHTRTDIAWLNRIIDQVDALRKLNRKTQKYRVADPHSMINASRIAEALINLGLETLTERAENLRDAERSASGDVSKGKDKLSNPGRHKAAKIRPVR